MYYKYIICQFVFCKFAAINLDSFILLPRLSYLIAIKLSKCSSLTVCTYILFFIRASNRFIGLSPKIIFQYF